MSLEWRLDVTSLNRMEDESPLRKTEVALVLDIGKPRFQRSARLPQYGGKRRSPRRQARFYLLISLFLKFITNLNHRNIWKAEKARCRHMFVWLKIFTAMLNLHKCPAPFTTPTIRPPFQTFHVASRIPICLLNPLTPFQKFPSPSLRQIS